MIATVDRRPLVNLDLVRWHLIASAVVLRRRRCSAGSPTRSSSTTSIRSPASSGCRPGRVRMVHTNMAAYGFIANAFIAGMLFAIPRLTAPADPLRPARLAHLRRLAARSSCSPSSASSPATARRSSGARRRSSSTRSCWSASCSWSSTCRRRSSGRGEHGLYVSLWYFLAAFAWTGLVYFMGNYLPQFWVPGHGRRGDHRPLHPRPRRALRHADRLGPDVLLRAAAAAEADLEPRALADRLLGARLLLPDAGRAPLPLQPDPDVRAVRRRGRDDRRRDRRAHGDRQLLRHAARPRRRDPRQPADPLVLHRHGHVRASPASSAPSR